MKNDKQMIPEIRFPGFTGPWEQRKLGSLIRQPVTDGPHETPKLLENGIPFLSVEAIHDGVIDVDKCRGYISEEDDLKYKKKYIPEIGDVYFTKAATIGRVAVVRELGFNIWSPIGAIKPDLSVLESDYLYYYLQTEKIQKGAIIASNNGTQHNLAMDAIENFDIVIPNTLEEQKSIASLLLNLDNLITLHQRKCDGLRDYKKGLLQQMFPKPGESTPRIRFPGYTGPWEQRKLYELVDYSNGTGHEENVVDQGKYELITLKSINSEGKLVSSEKYINQEIETLKQGTIIMMLSEQAKGMLGMTTVIPCNDRYVLNQRVAALTLHNEVDASFLSKAINNKQAYFEKMGAGTKVQNISKGHVENCILAIPYYEEQKKIGEIFDILDNFITLHQRKCDELKTYKKGLLQKMFV